MLRIKGRNDVTIISSVIVTLPLSFCINYAFVYIIGGFYELFDDDAEKVALKLPLRRSESTGVKLYYYY